MKSLRESEALRLFFVQKKEIFFLQIGCQMTTEDKVSVIDEMQNFD